MSEKYSRKYPSLNLYNLDNSIMRQAALLLTSLIPLFLLFSRVVADGALTIVAVLFLAHSVNYKNHFFIRQPLITVLLMLWAWFMFSSIFAFHSCTDSFAASFAYIRFILFFTACTNWLFTEAKALKFVTIIISITILVAACDALWQFFTDYSLGGNPKYENVRLTSFLTRPNIGIYLLKLIFPISGIWVWFSSYSSEKKNLSLCCFLLIFTCSIVCLTGERAATALTLFTIILSLMIIGINYRVLRLYMTIAICSLMTMFTIIFYTSPYIKVRTLRFLDVINNFPTSYYGQLTKASLLSWQENIFTGVGFQQFRHACLMFEQQGLVTFCTTHSHNIYLEILSETGIVGLSLLVIFIILVIYKSLTTMASYHKNYGIFISSTFVLAGLTTIFFPVNLSMSFITNWSAVLNWLCISLCISLLNLIKAQPFSAPSKIPI